MDDSRLQIILQTTATTRNPFSPWDRAGTPITSFGARRGNSLAVRMWSRCGVPLQSSRSSQAAVCRRAWRNDGATTTKPSSVGRRGTMDRTLCGRAAPNKTTRSCCALALRTACKRSNARYSGTAMPNNSRRREFDYIEAMACPGGGCLNGGGQVRIHGDDLVSETPTETRQRVAATRRQFVAAPSQCSVVVTAAAAVHALPRRPRAAAQPRGRGGRGRVGHAVVVEMDKDGHKNDGLV